MINDLFEILEVMRFQLRNNCEPVIFYMTSLFLASVQRHLQHAESPDITLALIEDVSCVFYC